MYYYVLLGVLFGGDHVSVLTDSLLSTCIRFPYDYFMTRAVVTFVLKKPYFGSMELLVQGRGMQCELSPNKCRKGFTTAVIQQGRTNHTCVGQPSPCPGAVACEPLGMTPHSSGMVSCRYRCRCPDPVDDGDKPCETILYSIGNGAQVEAGEDIEICNVGMDWYHWCFVEWLLSQYSTRIKTTATRSWDAVCEHYRLFCDASCHITWWMNEGSFWMPQTR